MARFRKVTEKIYWSSCPTKSILEKINNEKIGLVVNLTYECVGYNLSESIEIMHYPIMDFSFLSPEETLFNLLMPLSKKLEEGTKILIHCLDGIGRSGTLVAMLLVYHYGLTIDNAFKKVYYLGGGPESNVQQLSFRWFYRNLRLFGNRRYTEIIRLIYHELGRKIGHLSTVANITVDLLEVLKKKYSVKDGFLEIGYLCGLFHELNKNKINVLFNEIDEVFSYNNDEKALIDNLVYPVGCDENIFGQERFSFESKLVVASLCLADSFGDVFSGYGSYYSSEVKDDKLIISGNPQNPKVFEEKSKLFKLLSGLKIRINLESMYM
ncbi:MAG: dual specificity protein phosphatase family protein [Thermoproteales archaeon]|nr:dual specificity protein phosphatase family protein [Thermoproteales archaeon]